MTAADRLLVALDVETLEEAAALLDRLRGVVSGCKVGSQLFTAAGPAAVELARKRDFRVFLDLKFHDIPNTVAGAVAAATRLGVWMLNVHASGGTAMMQAARQAADDEAARTSRPAPLVVAVTMLTSLSDASLAEIGVVPALARQVERLAALAQSAGLDGVVASPHEIAAVRSRCGNELVIVTPGIRGAGESREDQMRTMSAAEALAAGASYIVVGRPIIEASDPRAAAERIAAEAFHHRGRNA